MQRLSHSFLLRYGTAVCSVALALALTLPVDPLEATPSSLFFAAVMVSAWYGGLGPGLVATALSALALDIFFLPLFDYSLGMGLADSVRLGVFILVSILISSLSAARKQLAASLQEQNRRKDNFLVILAHELRNPLAPILNGLHILRLPGTDAKIAEQTCDLLERQIQQLSRLIDDLLDVSRVSRGKTALCKERVGAAEAVAQAVEAVRPLFEARRHRLDVTAPSEPLKLDADPPRLQQILVNLLTNACKYTDPGGRIRMTVERAGSEVLFRVRDSGIGISPEVLPHIFDLFMQAEDGSQGGLGIGLHLVRGLVQLHGGSIVAHSAGLGQGSEFVVRLPLPAADSGREVQCGIPRGIPEILGGVSRTPGR